jgi:hypothetical protein
MKKAAKVCIIAASTLAVGVVAWSTGPFTLSQMAAMVKKKTEVAEEGRRAGIIRDRAVLAAQAVAMLEGPGRSLAPQFKPLQKPKGSAAFLATEARFANATEKPASTPEADIVNSSPPPAPRVTPSVVLPAPTSNVPKPTRKLRGVETDHERHLDSVMRDALHPIPEN